MTESASSRLSPWQRFLRRLVVGLAFVAGAGTVAMMLVTCVDVVARAFGQPLKGSYDIVRMLSLITLSCALPYTTAVKGHVAVEFFFNKLPPAVRLVVDSIMRILTIGLFGLLCVQGVKYGLSLKASGEVMLTLGWPVYWTAFVIAFACAVSALVVAQHLLHPRKVFMSS
jgi:TRAP-type C4-dicarboxylate transport system permease small subunit